MLGTQGRRSERHSRSRSVSRSGSNRDVASEEAERKQRGGSGGGASMKTPSGVGDESRRKTFMDRWVEPALAEKPSYRDHGGSPYGVLEHMQPLGELPNARVKARVKPEITRKSTGSKIMGLDARESPEDTPAPFSSSAGLDDGVSAPPFDVDDARDGDFAPGGSSKRKERPARTQAAKRRSLAAVPTPTPAPAPKTESPGKKRAQKQPAAASARAYTDEKLKQIVEIAKTRAVDMGRPDMAEAVNEVYEQSLDNARLLQLLEAVLTQTATREQIEEFQSHVRTAKRKIKAAKEQYQALHAVADKGFVSTALFRPQPTFVSPAKSSQQTAAPTTDKTHSHKKKLSLKLKPPHKHSRGRPPKMAGSPEKRGRSDSDSSLTSLTSNEDDVGAADSNGAQPHTRNSTRTKDHAAERASLTVPARGTKRSSAEAELHSDEADPARMLATKKQKLSLKVERQEHFPESNIREALEATPSTRTRSQQVNGATDFDHGSPLSSPLSSSSTKPRIPRIGPDLLKPPGRKAKIKQSPEKKHATGYTGLSGIGAARLGSPIGADDNNEELSENNDYCSACSASGFLLCCDGCDRSFHFACLDPPLSENASELNEPWYCFICIAKRPLSAEQAEQVPRGLLAPLLINLRKRNPSNFALPLEIRDYFEGVGADKHGNFIEAVHARPRNRAGYDEAPDYTRIKDAKGNTVLCYHCSLSSQGTRPILQCDFCGQHWHLDCLDPPLANPPALNMEGKKAHDWMCPLHADQELRKLDTSLLMPRRTIHMRKPRNAKLVEVSLRRGFHNNGLVDIIDDDTDSSGSEFYDEETQDEAVVYRLPASGIKLDFIDKVKNTRMQQLRNTAAYRSEQARAPVPAPAPPRQLQQANFARRSFRDKQMALNLTQFASENKDLSIDGDQVENLVATLIAEAPTGVVDQMAAAEHEENALSSSAGVPPSPPSSEQTDQLSAAMRRQMELLQELIRRRLEHNKT